MILNRKGFIICGGTSSIGSALITCIQEEYKESPILSIQRKKEHNKEGVLLLQKDFATPLSSCLDQTMLPAFTDCNTIYLVLTVGTVLPIQTTGEFETSDIVATISINYLNHVILINEAILFAKKQGKKLVIISLDSGAAYKPIDGWSLYCSTKAGLSMFLQCCKKEQEEIDVVSFNPSVVDSPMQENIRSAEFKLKDVFVTYKEENQLRSPMEVAKYMVERYIKKWEAKEFCEKIV